MQMQQEKKSRSIAWYKTPLDRELLRQLNQRSNWKGMVQATGFLGLLMLSGGTAFYSAGRWPVPVTIMLLFLHGTFFGFMNNAMHELIHKTVFKSRFLTALFVRLFGFFGWRDNLEVFESSHLRHHAFTLHPPDDQEVVLPMRQMAREFLTQGFINVRGMYVDIKSIVRISFGKLEGWELVLFPVSDPVKRRAPITWARTVLLGHSAIIAVSIWFQWWMLPVVTTFAPFYGGWLAFLCNRTQHIGLQDNVSDFRLCCRTMTINPLLRFLYWHMNFHIEHHMYPTVPCYNLRRLHDVMKHDLPPCPVGLVPAWTQIAAILKRQESDPTYQYIARLPSGSDQTSM